MKPHKFGARPCFYKGIKFPSTLERDCFRLAESVAETEGWLSVERQKKFDLIPCQQKTNGKFEQPISYRSDISLTVKHSPFVHLEIDTKSEMTRKLPAYVHARKLMLFIHKIEIVEISSVAQMEDLIGKLKNS